MNNNDLEDLWRLITAWLSRPSALSRDVRNGRNGLLRLRDLISQLKSEWTSLMELGERAEALAKRCAALESDKAKLERGLHDAKDALAIQAELDATRAQLLHTEEQLQSLQSTIGMLSADTPQVVVHEIERQVPVEVMVNDSRVPELENKVSMLQNELQQSQKVREALEQRCAALEQDILNMGAEYGAR